MIISLTLGEIVVVEDLYYGEMLHLLALEYLN